MKVKYKKYNENNELSASCIVSKGDLKFPAGAWPKFMGGAGGGDRRQARGCVDVASKSHAHHGADSKQ